MANGATDAALNGAQQNAAREPSSTDVMTNTWDGMKAQSGDPVQMAQHVPAVGAVLSVGGIAKGLGSGWHSSSLSGAGSAAKTQAGQAVDEVAMLFHAGDGPKPQGVLQHLGLALHVLTTIEQGLSALLSVIPFPALPAVRVLDFDIGLPHAHNHPPNLIPPAPPVPLPSTGPVIPIPFLSGANKTLINGMPAARCMDMGLGIWCGGYFPMYEIFLGSSSVWIDGARAARVAVDITKHCVMTTKPKDPVIGPFTGFTISSSSNVLIGGVPMPSLLAMLMKYAMKLFFKGVLKPLASALQSRLPAGSKINQLLCHVTGHPVDVASGRVFTNVTDFSLPGPIPLTFERSYDTSASDHSGALGHGWSHSLDLHLWRDDAQEMVIVREKQGRLIGFEPLEVGDRCYNPAEKLWLERRGESHYVLWGQNHLRHHFVGGEKAPANKEASALRLGTIQDANGNEIRLTWAGKKLTTITTSTGVKLSVHTDRADRIVGMSAPDPAQRERTVHLVQFAYDEHGDLIEARDSLGQPFRYAYKGHLLASETDRNGVSFFFEYDGSGAEARCVRTWGDGEIYSRTLEYDLAKGITTVTDSRGACTTYKWNALGVVTEVVDPRGGITTITRNQNGNPLAVVNTSGATTRYEYDAYERLTAVIDARGHKAVLEYDSDGNHVTLVDRDGRRWQRQYDARHNLIAIIDPLGGKRSFAVNSLGRVIQVVDQLGRATSLSWSERGLLEGVTGPKGGLTRLTHDGWGRVVHRVDPLGGETNIRWDSCGRLVGVVNEEKQQTRFTYDAEGNMLSRVDPLGMATHYAFGPRGRVTFMKMPDGERFRFRYDREMDLVEVENPRNQVWRLERDISGRIVKETTFHGRNLTYEYDKSGRLVAEMNGRGQRTSYKYDVRSQVVEKEYADGKTDKFEYDAQGRLIKAEGAAAEVAWEFDAANRLASESLNGEVFRSEYDARNNRVRRKSPFGRTVDFAFDPQGQLDSLALNADPLMRLSHDPLGKETRRELRGGVVQSREYYPSGRLRSSTSRGPLHHATYTYQYDACGQLTEQHDSRRGSSRYQHDPNGRLARAAYPDGAVQQFAYDAAGDVPGAPIGSGAAAAGHDSNWTMRYDEDGNLVEKRGANLWWQYGYNPAGRMAWAWKRNPSRASSGTEPASSDTAGPDAAGPPPLAPDERFVEFTYDPLDRRVGKRVSEVGKPSYRIQYLWDNNILGGERRTAPPGAKEGASETEYVFRPESFEPIAQLSQSGVRLFDSDHLETPRTAYDASGAVTWENTERAFGERPSSERAPPFGFPGQYEDPEIGLRYNRYRYYDPERRMFTQPDPMGLAGGLQEYNYVPSPLTWVDPYGLQILWHYTNEAGMTGINASQSLNPSSGPVHARFGDGQYFTNIDPTTVGGRTMADISKADRAAGMISQGQLAREVYNDTRLLDKVSHYVAIDVTGLNVTEPRPGTFLIAGTEPLNLEGRIVESGRVC